MSLATRCTSCGTVFRVVQDQLRVSSGWVRCGRCSEVFNAVESLVDLEFDRSVEDVAPGAQGPTEAEAPVEAATVQAPPTEALQDEPAGQAEQPPAVDEVEPAPQTVTAEVQDVDPPVPADEATADEAVQVETGVGSRDTPSESLPPGAMPSFVRKAERAARWRQPKVRALLAVAALAAAGALGWQLAVTQHDWIVARWPDARSWIERICDRAGCQVQPLMRIDGLSVESSGLLRTGPSAAYRLQLVLRNREHMALRVPHVDLSLTDALGQTLARRVLTPEQLGAARDRIAASSELALAATLRTRDIAVVGYTIEIFYP